MNPRLNWYPSALVARQIQYTQSVEWHAGLEDYQCRVRLSKKRVVWSVEHDGGIEEGYKEMSTGSLEDTLTNELVEFGMCEAEAALKQYLLSLVDQL